MLIGGNSPVQGYTERGRQAAAFFGPGVMLWMPSAGPQDAMMHPGCLHILRLPNWHQGEDPDFYVKKVTPQVTAWHEAVPNLVLQLGNEPDLEIDHQGQEFPLYAAAMREAFEGVRLANPPLSVDNTAALTPHICESADYVFAHSYWETFAPDDIAAEQFGASYRHAMRVAMGRPVIVTEVNANPHREIPNIDWKRRNDQVARWLRQAEADGVHGACIYILDANSDPDAARDWGHYDIGPEAAEEIMARYAAGEPAPQPEPVSSSTSPLKYDGTRSLAALRAMVDAGSKSPGTSPFLDESILADLDGASNDEDVSVAVMLGWLKAENRMATDISDGLLRSHNGAGIKYVGQRLATSGADADLPVLAPRSEGFAPYCVFASWRDFFVTLAINIKTILPDAWEAGDLAAIARYYTGGDQGLAKVTYYHDYADRARYPDDGAPAPPPPDPPAPPPAPRPIFRIGLDPNLIADEALTQIDRVMSGAYDTRNGNHKWYLWCLSFVERVHEHAGISVIPHIAAADAGRWLDANGRLHRGDKNAPRGAVMVWDEAFWADGGHIAISLGDGTFIGTTDAGIAIRSGWQDRLGYMGWAFFPGVEAAVEGSEDMAYSDSVIDEGMMAMAFGALGIAVNPSSAIYTDWKEKVYREGRNIGVAVTQEIDMHDGRILQAFSSGSVAEFNQNDSVVRWHGTLAA